jgi:hypothetical protein
MRVYKKLHLFLIVIVVIATVILVGEAYAQKSAAGFGVPMGFEGGAPGPGMSPEMMAANRGMPGAMPPGFMVPGGRPGVQTGAPQPEIEFVKVKVGEKVICAKTDVVLKDVEVKEIPRSELGEGVYFDDGTHGDENANDEIWSKITIRKDVISEEANSVKEKLEAICDYARDMSPVEFYGVFMASEDRSPNLVSSSFLERRRDEFIIEFRQRALASYVNPDTGQYYQVYKEKPPVATVPTAGQQFFNPALAGAGMPGMEGMYQGGGPSGYYAIPRARGAAASMNRPGAPGGVVF